MSLDSKISALTLKATPSSTDELVIVDNDGAPVNKKTTVLAMKGNQGNQGNQGNAGGNGSQGNQGPAGGGGVSATKVSSLFIDTGVVSSYVLPDFLLDVSKTRGSVHLAWHSGTCLRVGASVVYLRFQFLDSGDSGVSMDNLGGGVVTFTSSGCSGSGSNRTSSASSLDLIFRGIASGAPSSLFFTADFGFLRASGLSYKVRISATGDGTFAFDNSHITTTIVQDA